MALVFIPQKVISVECCAQDSCSVLSDWEPLGLIECPEADGSCYMKKRIWSCDLTACTDPPTCDENIYECTYSSSSAPVVRQYPECTGEVTDLYEEYEIIQPCATNDTCFWNCEDENPLISKHKGNCY
jgi:hypothetical protein